MTAHRILESRDLPELLAQAKEIEQDAEAWLDRNGYEGPVVRAVRERVRMAEEARRFRRHLVHDKLPTEPLPRRLEVGGLPIRAVYAAGINGPLFYAVDGSHWIQLDDRVNPWTWSGDKRVFTANVDEIDIVIPMEVS